MSIIVPEIIILNTLNSLLKLIREDYATNIADPTKSLLYRILNTNTVQRYDLFEQAKTVFIIDKDDPRFLAVNLFFNAKRAAIPTIHITLPSEAEKDNAIGNGEGFREPVYEEDEDGNPTHSIDVYNRRFNARYNIIVTSDNTNEVILIYHFIRSCIVSLNAHFNLAGLETPKLSGGDLNINNEIVPPNVFMRAIGLDFSYNVEGQNLFKNIVLPFDVTVNSQFVIEVIE